jgi:hypothetical protein
MTPTGGRGLACTRQSHNHASSKSSSAWPRARRAVGGQHGSPNAAGPSCVWEPPDAGSLKDDYSRDALHICSVQTVIAAGRSEVVAVVIGGLLTAGFTLLIEWQRRRRETRVARRLLSVAIDDAVRTVATVVKDLRDDKQWPYETKDWAQSWTGQREALATGGLDDEDLRRFGAAFGALGQLQGSLATGRRNFVPDDANFLQTVERALTELGVAFPDDYDRLTDDEVAHVRARIEAKRPVTDTRNGA